MGAHYMNFEELKLAPAILKAVREQGYETPTPIQAQAIPLIMQGSDLLGGAQTGTGKTAAFTLPMLHNLSMRRSAQNKWGGNGIRALVLTPTRELAAQVAESVRQGLQIRREPALCGGVSGPAIREQVVPQFRIANFDLFAVRGRQLKRLTQTMAIDTEPCYSPDGQQLYFVSDRGGGPQIYRMPAEGGAAERVSFNSPYNVSPALSPDGRHLAYVARLDGAFKACVMELATGTVRVVSDLNLDVQRILDAGALGRVGDDERRAAAGVGRAPAASRAPPATSASSSTRSSARGSRGTSCARTISRSGPTRRS